MEDAPTAVHNNQPEFSQPDSGLVVLVFQKGDDPIDAINHMMSFLTVFVTYTGDKLLMLLEQHEKYTPGASGSNSGENNGTVICLQLAKFNCIRVGHMAKQCTYAQEDKRMKHGMAQDATYAVSKDIMEPIRPNCLNKSDATPRMISITRKMLWSLRDIVEHVKRISPQDLLLEFVRSHEENRKKLEYKNFLLVLADPQPSGQYQELIEEKSKKEILTTNRKRVQSDGDIFGGNLRKPIVLESESPKPVVKLVYSRKPKGRNKNTESVSKTKVIKPMLSKLSYGIWGLRARKHMTGDRSKLTYFSVNSWVLSHFFEKLQVKFGNDQMQKIRVMETSDWECYYFKGLLQVTSDQSSSSDVIHTIVPPDHQVSEHNSKWTKDHPLENIIVEPKNYKDALTQACWIEAMQEELYEFKRLEVWELSSPLTKHLISDKPNYVYKLKKALYGLKQAPRTWYDMLSSFLISNDFSKGSVDLTLFIRREGNELLLVQIYVDDIIFAASTHDLYADHAELFKDTRRPHLAAYKLLGVRLAVDDDHNLPGLWLWVQ
ncbi:copia protein [Tanacetum coccineum]